MTYRLNLLSVFRLPHSYRCILVFAKLWISLKGIQNPHRG